MKRIKALMVISAMLLAGGAQADAVAALKDFVREVKSGRAQFSQVVSSPDGQRKKTSSGSFEFQRPNQFRFAYTKPFEQVIVGDGQKVWIFDPDLNQASSRRMSQALGATPAALLAGGNLERDFKLKALASEGGLDWVQAEPKQGDGGFQSLKIAFKGSELAALEIIDGFGQRSRLDFTAVTANAPIPAERFRFVLPAGADLIEQ
ncbi:outer membrane lipoprotein carrier protein [Paucibacter oligotrophus]|uniref:Outer-membrane lipoprotein carrier protein n=1 Tax=Roseateles oligotrophus TaxID=1769250 RepID=A0A840L885_9BURK|nr:outer membrane lipoprotein chaperone LolA [Roseateles oligotrophus]MBB4843981.1 outer membrane lipoprotein carrier protein [Roseateles oligotrophus]